MTPAGWCRAGGLALALASASLGTTAATACAMRAEPQVESHGTAVPAAGDGLEHLVPDLATDPYRLEPGPRRFLHRLCFSPGYGSLGAQRLFIFRLAYNPNPWLGWEASLAHNPGQSVHAVLHSLEAVVRRPWPGRFQPYLIGGYGMAMVFPGRSLNADPVTKNTLSLGGGLECYVRSDLALRAETQYATVFGKQKDRQGVVAYDYLQSTIGLAFYRSIRP
jgi:hypothetical protein